MTEGYSRGTLITSITGGKYGDSNLMPIKCKVTTLGNQGNVINYTQGYTMKYANLEKMNNIKDLGILVD